MALIFIIPVYLTCLLAQHQKEFEPWLHLCVKSMAVLAYHSTSKSSRNYSQARHPRRKSGREACQNVKAHQVMHNNVCHMRSLIFYCAIRFSTSIIIVPFEGSKRLKLVANAETSFKISHKRKYDANTLLYFRLGHW